MIVTHYPASLHLPAMARETAVLAPDTLQSFRLVGSQRELGDVKIVDVSDQPFSQALQISTRVGSTQEWHVQVRAATHSAVHAGDVVLAKFWMRCVESMTGEGSVGFIFEKTHAQYDKLIEARLSVASEWLECFVPFRVERDFAAGEASVCFRVGYDRQTIELGDVELVNYGTGVRRQDLPRTSLTYSGRESDAEWRAAAAERIERHRKADLVFEVVDQGGKPIAGATVDVALRRHEFGFGAAVGARLLNDTSDLGRQYRRIVTSLFNRATFENDLKWPSLCGGVPPETDRAVTWLRERQIEIRGHNLVWPSWRWMPRKLQGLRDDPAELRRRTAAHVSDIASHFRGKLVQWDVVNEPYSEHDLLDLLGRDVMVDWFHLAREADPTAKLFLNDYGIFSAGSGRNDHADHFYDTLKFLRDRGAPLDGVGIQSHFAAELPSPEALLRTLDRFSEFGLPIESTELTVTLEDERLQAEYLRDYMTVLFSHPNVNGIAIWGFWARVHWRPLSALFADDWSIRPIGQMYADLVQKDWTTRTSVTTDAAGVASLRGFRGEYDVTVTTPGGIVRTLTATNVNGGGRIRVSAVAAAGLRRVDVRIPKEAAVSRRETGADHVPVSLD